MDFSKFHPYVYYATKYPFYRGQSSLNRYVYSSSITFITEGKGFLRLRDAEYAASPGMMVYMEPGQAHDWIADADEPMTHVCCYFDWYYVDRTEAFRDEAAPICYERDLLREDLLGESFPYPLPEISYVGASLLSWTDLLQRCFISNEHTNERTFLRSMSAQSHFSEFIHQFLAFSLQDSSYIPDPRISKLLERMEAELLNGDDIELERYSDEIGVSRGYFFELFKRTTGLSPIQYMNQFRISRAKEDLRSSNLSIMQIADKYHFSSVHYFSRTFRKYAGKSPQMFRESEH
ncbi:AraC family transcriptional regulator [Paenibacillus glycanilyticus]|uniref:helix-turn-helix domain-containing protein n=1 Tax=Paenibacillus glycanilyticus TaxID=126569 RepID=UPI00203C2CBF|nr:AraC family transcriptional regulator [Paenibacillus glycanilyticus]MCM3628231.1 AraC family transcriptional regulator [Paenibacillus glycanilyticus]